MGLSVYANSEAFFEAGRDEGDPALFRFKSLKGRFLCIETFLKRLAILPFALSFKIYKTFFRLFGVGIGSLLVLLTIGMSAGIREMFLKRVASMAKDLADWALLPLAIVTCFSRLLLAIFVHPGLYYKN